MARRRRTLDPYESDRRGHEAESEILGPMGVLLREGDVENLSECTR